MILDLTWTRRVCMTSSHKCSRGYANDGDVAKYILTLYNKTTNQVLSDTPLHSNIVGSLFQIRRPFFKYWLNAAELGAIIGDAGGVLVRHRQRRGFSTVKWNQFLPSSWTTVERQLNDSWTTVERQLNGCWAAAALEFSAVLWRLLSSLRSIWRCQWWRGPLIFQSAQSWRRDASGACDVSRRGHALNPRAQKQKTNKFLSHLIACLPFCLFVSNSSAFLMIRAPQRNTLASHQSNGRLDDKGNKQMKKKKPWK